VLGQTVAAVEAACDAHLSDLIAAVASARGVTLDTDFTRYEWRDAELKIRSYPAVLVRPAGVAQIAPSVQPGLREAVLPLTLVYGYQSHDEARLQLHMEHVPEALVMLAERMDELAAPVLGVEGNLQLRWDTRPWPGAEPKLLVAWAALTADFRIYTNAL